MIRTLFSPLWLSPVWVLVATASCTAESSQANNAGGAATSLAGNSATAGSSGTGGAIGAAGAAGASAGGGGSGSAGMSSAGSGGVVAAAGEGGAPSVGGQSGAGGGGGANLGGASSDAGPIELPPFSFFVTSIEAMRMLSGNEKGFGGDLTFGQADGLSGADEICRQTAEMSMAGAGQKQWRAFLSATTGGPGGGAVHAIDRVGEGPWYDRLGRLVAMTKNDLANPRPNGADEVIINDLPNESGIPNGYPVPGGPRVDNHHTLTGSNEQGMLLSTDPADTCNDWTSIEGGLGQPRCGVSWPRNDNDSWISLLDEGGCAPGFNLVEGAGPPQGDEQAVGANGGYGGIYCFSLTP